MEKIRSFIEKLIPANTPVIIKKVSKWTFIFLMFFALLMSFKPHYPVQMIASFLYFTVIAAVCALALPIGFRLMLKLMNKTTFIDLDERFRKNGYEPEMAQIMKHSNPFGAPNERVIAAYLYLMTEDYAAAREQLHAVSDAVLSRRYSAMERVSRIRLAAMTGNLERAEKLFTESAAALDDIYGQKPDLLNTYKPYLDDALEYYTLAAVLSVLTGRPEDVEGYRSLAQFQVQQRSTAAEADMLLAIFELNLLYAQGRLEEADAYAKQLNGEISCANVIVPGRQDDLLKLVGQARLFANISASSTVAIDIAKERALPQGIETSVPFSSEHGEKPDDMASIPFL